MAIGELGGGANPTLGLTESSDRALELTVLDISPSELERTPQQVKTLCVDLCAGEPPVRDRFDLVFCGCCANTSDPAARSTPTATPPFDPVATPCTSSRRRRPSRSLSTGCCPPGSASASGRPSSRPGNGGGKHGKFPARYSWCWGPTAAQLRRYRSVGFEIVSCDVGVGHGYYDRFPPLQALEQAKAAYVLKHPSPWLAAYVYVVLRRPNA